MIEICKGNILNDLSEAIVNPVNCVGNMGKGLALQFKLAYPENFSLYRNACFNGTVKLGKMFVTELPYGSKNDCIVNFPTKFHCRDNSDINSIKNGLQDLIMFMKSNHINTIAIPPIGCGLGNLDWYLVKNIIINSFKNELPDCLVSLYEPI